MKNVKQAKLNGNELLAGCDQNPIVEGNAGGRNISFVTDSELKNLNDSRIPANTRMSILHCVIHKCVLKLCLGAIYVYCRSIQGNIRILL